MSLSNAVVDSLPYVNAGLNYLAPMTEKPRGLSISDAILARKRLGARPMETVIPTSSSIRACITAARTNARSVRTALTIRKVKDAGLVAIDEALQA